MLKKTLASSIREELRARIQAGEWGERLPSEPDLVRRFEASRETVRKALAVLEAEGLIYRMHGKGTFIEEPLNFNPIKGFLSITEELARTRHPVRNQVLASGWAPPAQVCSPFLRGFFGDVPRVYCLDRLRLVKDQPLAVERSCFRESEFPGLEGQDLEGSLHGLMSVHYGLSPDRVRNRFHALNFRLREEREAARRLGSRQAIRVERALVLRRQVYYTVSFMLRTDLYPLEFIQLPGRSGEGVL
jgi:DNA-binding GntR family transcriptional regulator